MNKLKLVSLLGLCGLVLAACREKQTAEKFAADTENTAEAESNEKSSEQVLEVNTTLYEGMNGTYEILEIEQLQSALFPDKQIMALTINYTNTTEDTQSPWLAWAFDIAASQETEVTVETLDGANGQFPEGYKTEAVKLGEAEIKPGATVEVVIGHEILYPGQPVFLKDLSLLEDNGEKFSREITTE
ncbi:DUF5067 domain-containing protein [Desemzia sp. FAM 23991]|uniref:DUF5067 domain-containing protein n=1 Tax=unclassified Desemzia TaxID=2685243 RepID=UPI0038874919